MHCTNSDNEVVVLLSLVQLSMTLFFFTLKDNTSFIMFHLPQKHSTNHCPFHIIHIVMIFILFIVTHFNITIIIISNACASWHPATIHNQRHFLQKFLKNHMVAQNELITPSDVNITSQIVVASIKVHRQITMIVILNYSRSTNASIKCYFAECVAPTTSPTIMLRNETS